MNQTLSVLLLGSVCTSLAFTRAFAAPGAEAWRLIQRSADQDLYQAVDLVTNAVTGRILEEKRKFTAIATGLNFLDAENQWQPSRAEWTIAPDGQSALARSLRHPVGLSGNLTDADAVDILLPATESSPEVHLRLRPLAVGWYDPLSGTNLILGEVQPGEGVLTGPSEITFFNAISGQDISIRYTIRKSGLSQDLIVNAPPEPSIEALGLSPQTRLEWYSELRPDSPHPTETATLVHRERDEALRAGMVEPDIYDSTLRWGRYMMGPGRALALNAGGGATGAGPRVAKRFAVVDSRPVIIESAAYSDLRPLLAALPPRKTANVAQVKVIRPTHEAGLARYLPQPRSAPSRPIQLAANVERPSRPALLADWTLSFVTR